MREGKEKGTNSNMNGGLLRGKQKWGGIATNRSKGICKEHSTAGIIKIFGGGVNRTIWKRCVYIYAILPCIIFLFIRNAHLP